MKHFIGTRFNIRSKLWEKAKDGSSTLDQEWLNHRLNLFHSYCLPSMIHQECQDFYWCVFFDQLTPLSIKLKIDAISNDYSNFNAIYLEDGKLLRQEFKHFIEQKLSDSDKFIITTRLDNDDALHYKYVSTIQRLAIKQNNTVLDLRSGYQMDITKPRNTFRKLIYPYNPFISLVEDRSSIETVFSKKHNEWEQIDSFLVYDKQPLWLQIVHQMNIYNYSNKNIPLISKIDLADFGIFSSKRKMNVIMVSILNSLLKIKLFLKKFKP